MSNPLMDPTTRDRVLARERMRRLRAGGITIHDRARNYALKKLREKYPEDFDWFVKRYVEEVPEVSEPKVCAHCGTPVVWRDGSYRCLNEACVPDSCYPSNSPNLVGE